jgi:hypothetical protein
VHCRERLWTYWMAVYTVTADEGGSQSACLSDAWARYLHSQAMRYIKQRSERAAICSFFDRPSLQLLRTTTSQLYASTPAVTSRWRWQCLLVVVPGLRSQLPARTERDRHLNDKVSHRRSCSAHSMNMLLKLLMEGPLPNTTSIINAGNRCTTEVDSDRLRSR